MLAGVAYWAYAPASGPPRDRVPEALGALPDPARVTVLGTSLTARYDWPARLEAACGGGLTVSAVAQSGALSSWGLEQVARVSGTAPDVVLIEMSSNDADLTDGLWLRDSEANIRAIVTRLREADPEVAVVLMSMSPAQGLRGLVRPRFGAYADMYGRLADELELGYVDLRARWLALPRAARGLREDGLHPEPEVAAGVIVPVLQGMLCPAI